MDILNHHTEYGEDQTTRTTGGKKVLCFLFVRFLKGKVCANNFTIKAFENGKLFDTTAYGKVCSCAPALNCLYADRWRHHRMFKLKIRSK